MKILITFALVLFFAQSHAQVFPKAKAKVKYGDTYKSVFWGEEENFIVQNLIVTIKSLNKGVHIQVLNKSTLKVVSNNFTDDFPKKFTFEKVIQKDDKLFYFYSLFVKKPKKHRALFVRELVVSNGTLKSPKAILNTSGAVKKKSYGITESDFKNQYVYGSPNKFFIKPSKSGFNICYEIKNQDKLGVFVFDNLLNLKQGKEYVLPSKSLKIINYNFSNNKILMIGREASDKMYYSVVLKSNKLVSKETPFNKNYYFQRILLEPLKNGGFHLAAYFLDESKITKIKTKNDFQGVQYAKFSESGIVRLSKEIKFQNNIKYLEGSDEIDPYEKTISRFYINHLSEGENGVVFIGGQEMHKWHESAKVGGENVTYVHWEKKDIVTLKLDASGKKVWMNRFFGGGYGEKGLLSTYLKSQEHLFYIGLLNSDLIINKVNKSNGKLEVIKFLTDEKDKGFSLNNIVENPILFNKNEFFLELELRKKKDCMVKITL